MPIIQSDVCDVAKPHCRGRRSRRLCLSSQVDSRALACRRTPGGMVRLLRARHGNSELPPQASASQVLRDSPGRSGASCHTYDPDRLGGRRFFTTTSQPRARRLTKMRVSNIRFHVRTPKRPPPPPAVIVHNGKPGTRGAFIAVPSNDMPSYLVEHCTCGWAPRVGTHYRAVTEV